MMAKLWGYILGLGGIIVAIGGFFLYAKRQGKKDEQSEELQQSYKQSKESNEIDDRVHRMPDGELDERLRNVQRKD